MLIDHVRVEGEHCWQGGHEGSREGVGGQGGECRWVGRGVQQVRLEVLLVGMVDGFWWCIKFWLLVILQRRLHGCGNCFGGWLVVKGSECALIWLSVCFGLWGFVEFMWWQHGGGVRLV